MSVCLTPADCVTQVTQTFWSGFADQIKAAAGSTITDLFGWWTKTGSEPADQPVLHTASTFVITWVAFPVAVLALLATIGWGLLSGTTEWVRNAVRGSLVFGASASASIVVVSALQDWAEGLASSVLDAVPNRDVGARFLDALSLPGVTPSLVLFWAGLMLLIGALQWLLMLFRDGAVLVLTAMLPLAAAGQFAQASRAWLPKVIGWQLALIFYKPAAALIYWLGLSLLGQAAGTKAVAVALVVLLTATLSLPAMLRLVTFAVDGLPEGPRGLNSVATVVGIGATAAQLFATRGASAASAAGGGAGGGQVATGTAGLTAGARSIAGSSPGPTPGSAGGAPAPNVKSTNASGASGGTP